MASIAMKLRFRLLPRASASRLAAALLCVGLAACQPGADLQPLPELAQGPYRLGVNEQIRIITVGQDQLTGQFRVNDRGNIAIPLLGSIPADGMTTTEVEDSIAQRLKDRKLLVDPSVSVEVLGYRPVFVLGEVAKPGEYPYQPGMTVLTAAAVAGGFTYRAQTDYASVLRKIDGHPVEGKVTRSTVVLPGDVINVFDRYY